MIQDRSFNADGSFRYRVDLDRGFRGDTILVNGAVAPRMKVERRLYRLRFLNAANARAFTLSLGNNRAITQIGSEGGLLTKPVRRASIPLEPAERADVVIDFRQFGVGSKVILHNLGGEATTQAIMRFDVVRGGVRGGARAEGARRGGAAAGRERAARVAAHVPGPRHVDVADRQRRLRRDADRLPPAPGLDRAVDVDEQLAAHASDAPARLPLPGGRR